MSSFRLLSSIVRGTWLISKTHAEGYIPVVAGFLGGKNLDTLTIAEREAQVSSKLYGKVPVGSDNTTAPLMADIYEISDYGEKQPPEKAPKNSIAILSLQQVITKYDVACGPSGTLTKTNLLKRAANNPNIKAIILYVDSPGGEADGTESMADYIREIAKTKPVIAFVDGLAASAGYWITAAASEVIVNVKTAEVGSIGAYVSFADFRGAFEAEGIKIHTIYAPQSTEKNKDVRDIIDQEPPDPTEMQKSLKYLVSVFINSVKSHRKGKLKTEDNDPFKGAVYFAEEAKKIGLIDAIGTFEYAVERADALADLKSTIQKQNTQMNKLTAAYNKAVKAIGLEKFAINDEATEVSEENISQLITELASRGAEINTLTQQLSQAKDDLIAEQGKSAQAAADLQAAQTKAAEDKTTIENLQAEVKRLGAIPGAAPTNTTKEKDNLGDQGAEQTSWVDPNASHNKVKAELDKTAESK